MSALRRSISELRRSIYIPIASKLMLAFLLIIVLTSAVFIIVGVMLISDRFVAEAQEKVRNDLNTAREIYQNQLDHTSDVVGLTADRFFLRDALMAGDLEQATIELERIREEEGLDVLTVTDKYGYVLIRTSDPETHSDNQGHCELVHAVLLQEEPIASTMIISGEELKMESPSLAEQAYFEFIDTPLARPRDEVEETDGMMLKVTAPIFDTQDELIGALYGGVLLNRNYEIVDKVKQTVYEDIKYEGQDIGTATIFLDDVRISTNVMNDDGSRAIGTRVSEEVYNQVVLEGKPWIGRAYVVNNWYITAYEPIMDVYGRIIGILYVGLLEQKYLDIRRQTITIFLVITLAGSFVSLIVAYFMSQKISIPIIKLVSASKEVEQGNLDAKVEIATNDELQYLAESFNEMAAALKRRDERLRDFATRKIMESERLALIGQLAANVAHELNNPLQGIVAFSYLVLERISNDDPNKELVEKIVGQANRSRDIIRGLLDFSRQRKPDKSMSNVNTILQECIALVENQATFQNIQIVKDLQDDLPLVVLDPSQIERVFINIIINAAEAMDGEGQLDLTTRHDPSDDAIEVTITDTGCGIKEDDIINIFDPFFTTKEVGHGTGLGLAISYGIIKSHKGSVSVKSEVGKGSTFIFRLPIKVSDKTADHD